MFQNIGPSYLSALIPPTVNALSTYNLRNANNIQTIDSRTSLYYNSFLPSVIRDWNNLPLDTRNSDSLISFKRSLSDNLGVVPKHYYIGNRRIQSLHTRLRTKCSSLNNDLFLKNITDSPLCRCGNIENAHHFFLVCSFYRDARADLMYTISRVTNVTLEILLFGDSTLSLDSNKIIFEAVHKYIKETKRF